MLDAIDRIRVYVDGLDRDGFAGDPRTIDAVVYRFAVLGEAAAAVPSDVRAAHQEVPWREAADMRNVLVHEYFGVRVETVWKTIHDDLPGLAERLRALEKTPPP